MTDNSGRAPAGWYADTNQPGTERWWDGQAWTEHTRPAGAPPPPLAPSERQAAIGRYGAPQPAPAPAKQRAGCFGIATGVMVGIIAAVVILVGGCVALVAGGLDTANDELVSVATSTLASETTTAGDDAAARDDSVAPDNGGGQEIDDVVSCQRTDPQTIVLEVVNNTPKTSSYILTVGYFDDSGARLADETTFLNYLRPGERAIEEHFTFEEQGTTCEVLDAERFAAESIEGELAEVSACEVGGAPDVLGSIQASVSATNGTPETSDYAIDVAFVDADGVRRGSGAAFVESVRPGETAPSDIFTTLDHAEGYSCDVVAVTRNAS
ncbi:MAG: DUF2510 domain-containing protein [Acidimicrobiia bacterium]|nr:DUF2510 domain-containing protein [Acidimicrobiia bacterium]